MFALVNGSFPLQQKVHLLKWWGFAGQTACRDVKSWGFVGVNAGRVCIMVMFLDASKGVPFRALGAGGPMEGGSAT